LSFGHRRGYTVYTDDDDDDDDDDEVKEIFRNYTNLRLYRTFNLSVSH
jgi:hypothetical protein